jgi:hypothetical protein
MADKVQAKAPFNATNAILLLRRTIIYKCRFEVAR